MATLEMSMMRPMRSCSPVSAPSNVMRQSASCLSYLGLVREVEDSRHCEGWRVGVLRGCVFEKMEFTGWQRPCRVSSRRGMVVVVGDGAVGWRGSELLVRDQTRKKSSRELLHSSILSRCQGKIPVVRARSPLGRTFMDMDVHTGVRTEVFTGYYWMSSLIQSQPHRDRSR